MRIRNADMRDLPALTAVEAACFPASEAATERDFAARLAVYPNHFWLLEADDGRLISFVNGLATDEPLLRDEMYENAALHKENGAWQMIFGVNTMPEFRNRGYAAKVMEQVIADACAQGRKGCVLTCKERLIHYYETFGFHNEGVSKSVHGGVMWYDMRLTFAPFGKMEAQ
ncbi:Ribosomal protein S18 acetylase RimI [Oscillibacter sp. PC13]|uniref:GNAT family N-acetyltransferase n=1 Tax=Oscillibacter sp. PC13 TaxID=1855299 RepID=UPI0008EB2B9D|nr:GNAT family N-acetyltransferase [Oscillibacter sp. PC13]SFP20354.1 Ribosomal protein S18 acetylase RimI [Oscillibacter sp. PC13]